MKHLLKINHYDLYSVKRLDQTESYLLGSSHLTGTLFLTHDGQFQHDPQYPHAYFDTLDEIITAFKKCQEQQTLTKFLAYIAPPITDLTKFL